MPKNPPFCYICGKNFEKTVDQLHYCICDIAVCDKCINSMMKNEKVWICPKCKAENEVDKSKLFRIV